MIPTIPIVKQINTWHEYFLTEKTLHYIYGSLFLCRQRNFSYDFFNCLTMALCLPDLQKKIFGGDFFLTMIIITPTALNTNP